MPITGILLVILMADSPEIEPVHAKNDVYSYVLDQGLEVEGKKSVLPKPWFHDGQDGAQQKAILLTLAESPEELEQMLDNAPRAPHFMKHDEIQARRDKPDSPLIQVVDLCFVVYADLNQFDPASQMARIDGKKGQAESGDIKYETRLLKQADLRAVGINLGPEPAGQKTWFTQILGELPNKVKFAVIERTVATQTPTSVVVAARTDPAFSRGKPPSNLWRRTPEEPGVEDAEITGPYRGGITYAKASRLAFQPGALIVEMHAAWVEPYEWYQGTGPLGGKLKRAAMELIKNLREELGGNRPE